MTLERKQIQADAKCQGRLGFLFARLGAKARQGPRPLFTAIMRGIWGQTPLALRLFLVRSLTRRGPVCPKLSGPGEDPRWLPYVPGRVSVVLPVYNQATMLSAAIDSVLASDYPDFELVLINDGSTDNIEPVLAPYYGHPRVRLLSQENQTLPKALSNAFEFCRGEFLTWTSADNLLEPEQLTRLVAALRSRPDLAMIYADYQAIDGDGEPLISPAFRPQNRYSAASAAIRLPRDTAALNILRDNFIGPCFLYRGWVGGLIGEYDPAFGVEDYDYWMRLNALFRVEHLGSADLLYRYRVHAGGLIARAAELKFHELERALHRYERQRSRWYGEEWQVFGDGEARKLFGDGVTVAPWPQRPLPSETKSLLFLGPAGLTDLGDSELPAGCCLAIVYGSDPIDPFVHGPQVARRGAICFTSSPTVGAGLALFTDQVYRPTAPLEMLDLARTYGNNRTFYRLTRSAAATQRDLPAPSFPSNRKLKLFLKDGIADSVARGLAEAGHSVLREKDAVGDPDLVILRGVKGEGSGVQVAEPTGHTERDGAVLACLVPTPAAARDLVSAGFPVEKVLLCGQAADGSGAVLGALCLWLAQGGEAASFRPYLWRMA